MRSLLFVPADSEKKLDRARRAGADALIIDLEDSVTAARKAAARAMAVAYLRTWNRADASTPRLWVRINDLATQYWEADLRAVTTD